MFQFMASVLPSSGPKSSSEVSEIEQFRARHRRVRRGQTAATSSSKIEELDIDSGRTRKIPANWQQKQQKMQCRNEHDDGIWPRPAGTEMHLGYNAFDFSASPEAFYDEPEQSIATKHFVATARQQGSKEMYTPALPVEAERSCLEQQKQQHMTDMAKQATSMGFNSAGMWERTFPGLRHPGGPIQQMPPASGQTPLWEVPAHFTAYEQRRALYFQST